ncbi:MAG: MBL fold metallo-hydrolase [bacterium]
MEASASPRGGFAPTARLGSDGAEGTAEAGRNTLLARARQALGPHPAPALLREWESLQHETDPDLLEEALVQWGGRFETQGNYPPAAELYQALLQSHLSGTSRHRQTAQRRLDAIQGRGAWGGRAEFLLRNLAQQASDPSALLAMGAAGTVFRLTRLATLARLTGASQPGFLSRLLGASRLASLAGFALEAPTFTLVGRLGNEALGRPQDWSARSLRQDLAASYLVLGGLKLGGALSAPLAAGQAAPLRGLLQQGGLLGGIWFGHRLETWAGLRPPQDGATLLIDSLALLLQFQVAGNLGRLAFGPRFSAWEQGLDRQAEALELSRRARTEQEVHGMVPASWISGVATAEPPLPPFAFAMTASGRGPGRRLPPDLLGMPAANHNHEPVSLEPSDAIPKDRLQPLPRGGVVLQTEAGKVQFGVPMWTNKDAFEIFQNAGGARLERDEIRRLLPSLYVFDLDYVARHDGLLPADFMQYMYFVNRGQELTLLAPDAATAKRLREFLDLSYRGPEEGDLNDKVRREYPRGSLGVPQMGEEIRRGFPAAEPEVLRRIAHFDEAGEFHWEGLKIRKLGPRRYEVWERSQRAGILDLGDFPVPPPATDRPALSPAARAARRRVLREGRPGLWPIGTGHGFTPREETSGFMLWNGGKTVLIDPPSSTLSHLRENRIPLEAVDGILLTHGHTDHYGNAVPQLLALRPELKIYTTPTIFRMLREQYQLAVGSSGLPWNFIPLYPQSFSEILDLPLRPDYTFHPVPALGFEIYDRPDLQTGRLVLAFTGDSFADHVELWQKMRPEGAPSPIMSVARAQQVLRHGALLMASKGQQPPPIFLIEGGVPPIHIPPARTRELLDQAEQLGVDTSRVRLYHVAAEAAAAARVAKWVAGPEGFFDLSEYFRKNRR